jgi:hypothetical protein
MAKKNFIQVVGDEDFMKMARLLPAQFNVRVMRDIARRGGGVVVRAARRKVSISGTLGGQIKSDIGVVTNRSDKTGGVKVKLRNKEFHGKDGKQRVVSKIARHFTEGVKQTDRKTKKKGIRGRVKERHNDFILDAGQSSEAQVMAIMKKASEKIINRHIAKWQRKLR